MGSVERWFYETLFGVLVIGLAFCRPGAAVANPLIRREGRVRCSIGFELTILSNHFGRAIIGTATAHVGQLETFDTSPLNR